MLFSKRAFKEAPIENEQAEPINAVRYIDETNLITPVVSIKDYNKNPFLNHMSCILSNIDLCNKDDAYCNTIKNSLKININNYIYEKVFHFSSIAVSNVIYKYIPQNVQYIRPLYTFTSIENCIFKSIKILEETGDPNLFIEIIRLSVSKQFTSNIIEFADVNTTYDEYPMLVEAATSLYEEIFGDIVALCILVAEEYKKYLDIDLNIPKNIDTNKLTMF